MYSRIFFIFFIYFIKSIFQYTCIPDNNQSCLVGKFSELLATRLCWLNDNGQIKVNLFLKAEVLLFAQRWPYTSMYYNLHLDCWKLKQQIHICFSIKTVDSLVIFWSVNPPNVVWGYTNAFTEISFAIDILHLCHTASPVWRVKKKLLVLVW